MGPELLPYEAEIAYRRERLLADHGDAPAPDAAARAGDLA